MRFLNQNRFYLIIAVVFAIFCPKIPFLCYENALALPFSQAKPFQLLVFGDSVTMAVWADQPLGHPQPSLYLELAKLRLGANLAAWWNGVKVNDLSNAINYSRFIDQHFSYIARKHLSGLIGSKDYSIPKRLEKELQRPINITEASILAGSYLLSPLIFEKLDLHLNSKKQKLAPDLIIIDFHAMDFVFNRSITDFRQDVRKTISEIIKRYPEAPILVASFINLVNLMNSAKDQQALPPIPFFGGLYCYDSYREIGFDKAIGIESTTDEQQIFAKERKLLIMQRALEEEIDTLNHATKMKSKSKIIALAQQNPPQNKWLNFLSIDCIHPNSEGQKLISENIWQSIKTLRSSHRLEL